MSEEKIINMISDLKDSVDLLNKKFDAHEIQQKEDFRKINERLDIHEAQQKEDFRKINERFDKQEEDFKKMNERLDKHEAQQEEDFKKMNERFDIHERNQIENFAGLESLIYDRTEALFDARQISIEKYEDLYSKVKSTDGILEDYGYRILELESKAN